ncbi:MAG: cation:proton antiporter, partial [Dehalococcoidia bacterium]|nr:cation:proton antiporter [Dehalococcoidia bacterium]
MHIEGELFTDIVIIFVAAFLGGMVARVLRFPILLGFLAVGMVIGPHSLEVVGNVETVTTLAEFGVILLLFAVGIEVSFRDLRRLGKVVALGGLAQIVGTSAIAYFIGVHLFGWTPEQAFVFGMVVALSSTMVVLKTFTDRGELGTVHGRVITGILLVQDLAFIPMIAILPALSSQGVGLDLADLGLGILKATVILGLMATLGWKVIPWLLDRVAHLGSREIFILAVVAITFATAAITQLVDLSAALGAFVAGLVLSESNFGRRALSEVIPLRDTFSALFFVSLGMLTDPSFLVENFDLVLAVVAIAILVKFALTAVLTRSFGYLPHTALLAGLGMGQVGEFSFILTDSASALGIVNQDFLSLVVVSAVLTMALTPWIIAGGTHMVTWLSRRVHILRPYRLGDDRSEERRPQLHDHVVICGLGRVGSLVADTLSEQNVPFVAIDLNPHLATRFRGRWQYGINGSSSSESVLEG